MTKDLEYYMGLPYRVEVVEDKEEGGFAQRSSEEGVSMNQYCVYLLSRGI